MNILLIIAAIFIVTETIDPGVEEGVDIQKKEVVAETVETKPAEEVNSEAQAVAAQAQAEAKAEAEAAAQAEEEVKAKAAAQAEEEAKAEAEAAAQAQAAAEAEAAAQAQAAAEAEAAAEKEINYLKIALYIILILTVLSGALLYFRKRDKSPLESKITQPERKEQEQLTQEEIQPKTKEQQPIQEETQPETKEEQPIDTANKEPTNFEETNEDEKK